MARVLVFTLIDRPRSLQTKVSKIQHCLTAYLLLKSTKENEKKICLPVGREILLYAMKSGIAKNKKKVTSGCILFDRMSMLG